MPDYTLSNGDIVTVDGDLTPAQKVWLQAQGGLDKQAKASDVLQSLGSGIGEGAVRAPFFGGDLLSLGAMGVNHVRPGTLDPRLEKPLSTSVIEKLQDSTGPFYSPQTTEGRYANAAGTGIGGGVLGGPKALTSGWQALQNALIGMGGEAAGDLSRSFDESKPQNPLVKMGGSLATALLTAIGSRAGASRFSKPVYSATKDIPEAGWNESLAEAMRLKRAGANSATIADTMPAASPIRALTSELSNAPGGQALYQKLAGRNANEGEITNLVNQAGTQAQEAAVPQLAGPFSPTKPMQTQDQAIVGMAEQNRTNAAAANLTGAPDIPALRRQAIVQQLLNARNQKGLGTNEINALEGAADTLGQTTLHPVPAGPLQSPTTTSPAVMDPNALWTNLTSVKTAKPPGPDAVGAKKTDAYALSKAAREASDLVGQESPAIAAANQTYAKMSPQVELAQLLAENKLKPIPSFGQSSLGSDTVRQQLAALLARVAPNEVTPITEKLRAADRLSMMHNEPGVEGIQSQQGQSAVGMALTPRSSIARILSTGRRSAENSKLAEILANPTPENFKKLRDLSKVDPAAARLYREIGNLGAVDATSEAY